MQINYSSAFLVHLSTRAKCRQALTWSTRY